MRQLTSIVARNPDGAIGAGNRLPWRVRTDLKFFRDRTLNNVVIMGRRTYDSLSGCLPKRENIVLTHGFSLFPDAAGCRSAGNISEALLLANKLSVNRRETFVVGGATMYRQFADLVDRYLITEVDKVVPDADTFFHMEVLGDLDRWDKRLLIEGRADGVNDEASFKIFEYVSRDAAKVRERRSALIEELRRKIRPKKQATILEPRVKYG